MKLFLFFATISLAFSFTTSTKSFHLKNVDISFSQTQFNSILEQFDIDDFSGSSNKSIQFITKMWFNDKGSFVDFLIQNSNLSSSQFKDLTILKIRKKGSQRNRVYEIINPKKDVIFTVQMKELLANDGCGYNYTKIEIE